jgi:hypothetical protein
MGKNHTYSLCLLNMVKFYSDRSYSHNKRQLWRRGGEVSSDITMD